jgi:hypothetical protein
MLVEYKEVVGGDTPTPGGFVWPSKEWSYEKRVL